MTNPAKTNENTELELPGDGQPSDSSHPPNLVLERTPKHCVFDGDYDRSKKIDVGT